MDIIKKYISEFMKPYEEELNFDLMNKTHERPLHELLIECFKSLEMVENIKIISWEYDDNEDHDINQYVRIRTKIKNKGKKNKKEIPRVKYMKDTRFGSLTIKIELSCRTTAKNGIVDEQRMYITRRLIVPTFDENGYLFINGKKYYLLYQLLEKSSYVTALCVVVKSLMPLTVKRNKYKSTDIEGIEYTLPIYNVFIFKNEVNVLLIYASQGLQYALEYLGVSSAMRVTETIDDKENNLYFPITSKIYLEVNKELFDKHTFVQAMTGMLLEMTNNRFNLSVMNNGEYWVKKLDSTNSYEKGLNILVFFNRLIDETTKYVLKVPDVHKKDVYSVLRWVMHNYNDLRQKDNLNIENKRLRCNEYIASLLTAEFSNRLNRIVSMGKKAGLDEFKEIFQIPGDLLIKKMHESGILRTEEIANDMDFFNKFKFTKKGPHALGNKNEKNISIIQRGLHPSYLGYVDISVNSSSDPGTSGLLSPFCNIDGLYFDKEDEPNNFSISFIEDVVNIMKKNDIEFIHVDYENPVDYYNALHELYKLNNEVTALGVSNKENTIEVTLIKDKQTEDEAADAEEVVGGVGV